MVCLTAHVIPLLLGMWRIPNLNPTEPDTFSEIHRILKIWSCRIQNFCFGPTLQVWITVHWLMERSVVVLSLLVICPIAIAYSMGQIKNRFASVCVCITHKPHSNVLRKKAKYLIAEICTSIRWHCLILLGVLEVSWFYATFIIFVDVAVRLMPEARMA